MESVSNEKQLMLDRSYIGKSFPPHSVEIEKGQLRFFAKAVGETNPIYTDEDAAKAAGYSSLPAPPTFGLSMNLAVPDPFAKYIKMGVDLGRVLHGEQQFEYLGPICAGDTITLNGTIKDIYDKKGGALEFLIEQVTMTNQHGVMVGRMVVTTVVRNA